MANAIVNESRSLTSRKCSCSAIDLHWLVCNMIEAAQIMQKKISSYGAIGLEIINSEAGKKLFSLMDKWEKLYLNQENSDNTEVSNV